MLEPILKGLIEWIYGLMVEIMSYASGELLGVLSMNLDYFEDTAPVISEIVNVFVALGWALLIGNMVFQLLKSMASGLGFEAEDPKIIFLRSFVFSFLLMASRQICDIGLSITGRVIDLLEMPDSIEVVTPDESMFSLGGEAKWLLVIIVGVVLMVQMVKLLFEIGERYVITSVLTFFSPLAFAMGGSRNTNDIFKGWCRMYGSMMILMIMNIVFLKLIMSAMSQISSGGVLIWLVFVVALTRVARKIDSHIGKLGLNPAQTGDGLGSRIPGMMTVMAARALGSTVSRSLRGASSAASSGTSGGQKSRGGASHLHRYPKPYTSTGSSERANTSGTSYYTGEGSTAESSATTTNVDTTAVTGGGISVSGHGGSNMSSQAVVSGNTEVQNSQSNMAGDAQASGVSSVASAEHKPQGTPPLPRKTSAGKAPTGNPTGHGNTGAQPASGGADIQSTSAFTNASSADIHNSEVAMQQGGSIGHGTAMPLPRTDGSSVAQPDKGQSGGVASQNFSATSSQHSSSSQNNSASQHGNLESHGSGTPLPRAGAQSEAGTSVPLPKHSDTKIPTVGISTVGNEGTPSNKGGSVPLPRSEASSAAQPDKGQSGGTVNQNFSAASSQHGNLESHGSGTPLPKAGAQSEAGTSPPLPKHSDTKIPTVGISAVGKGGSTINKGSSTIPTVEKENPVINKGVSKIPMVVISTVGKDSTATNKSGATIPTIGSESPAVNKGSSTIPAVGKTPAVVGEGAATSKSNGKIPTVGISAVRSESPAVNKGSSTIPTVGKTPTAGGESAATNKGNAKIPMAGNENTAANRGDLKIPTVGISTVGKEGSTINKGSSTIPTVEKESPVINKGASEIPTVGKTSAVGNEGTTINKSNSKIPTVGISTVRSESQAVNKGSSTTPAVGKAPAAGGDSAATSKSNAKIPTVGNENTPISKGVTTIPAAGNTVVNENIQPTAAGHGDREAAGKVTSIESSGDTNIENRNFANPERTVEKESGLEHGKDEHMSGKASGTHASTAFSRNRGPAEGGERINHEYTHGKYDPASANRKTDNQFFVKETLKGGRIKRERMKERMKSRRVLKRGEKNGPGRQ